MEHDVGNTLQYKDNHAGLRTLPRNPGECVIFRFDEHGDATDVNYLDYH
jgi:plasmid maintenance system killer protein